MCPTPSVYKPPIDFVFPTHLFAFSLIRMQITEPLTLDFRRFSRKGFAKKSGGGGGGKE